MSNARQATRLLIALIFALCGILAQAREATPLAADEAVEKRMVEISDELRCLVCQNESLSGSHAELAVDLRREIRGMIKQGRSNDEIMEFMVSRYGDFVRYRPPLKATTVLLWFGPFILAAGAVAGLVVYLRRRRGRVEHDATILSPEDRQRAEALLQQDESEKT
ncbi:MAG: cytochrome c-type biogenesis protein CcmH [Sulfuritalea sp.]|nr:cytochrome c-type biogenesis protein CcmH [Sulfuritalea sp.]